MLALEQGSFEFHRLLIATRQKGKIFPTGSSKKKQHSFVVGEARQRGGRHRPPVCAVLIGLDVLIKWVSPFSFKISFNKVQIAHKNALLPKINIKAF